MTKKRTFAWVQTRKGTPIKLFERGSPSPIAAAQRYVKTHKKKTGKTVYAKWNWRK